MKSKSKKYFKASKWIWHSYKWQHIEFKYSLAHFVCAATDVGDCN